MQRRGDAAPLRWWEGRGFAAALIFLSVVPLLYPQFPPLVDLPSHMGRYKIAMGDSDLLARFYEFRWHLSGNLGADLLIVPLSWLIGPEAATKFVAILIPPLVVGALLAISKAVHGRLSPTAAMVVPLAYTQPFLYGFLNYVLAVAIALWALYLFHRLGQAGRLRLRAALMVPLGFLLFVTHASGWGILGLTAFASEWARCRGKRFGGFRAIWQAAQQMVPLMLPLLLLLWWQSDASGVTGGWFEWDRKIIWSALLFRDLWPTADQLTSLFVFGFAVLVLVICSWRFDPAIGFGALALFGAFLVLPFVIFGSALSDIRVLPVSLMLLFVSVRPFPAGERVGSHLALAATGFALARMAVVAAGFAVAGDRQRTQISVLAEVERGARIAVAVGSHCQFWPLPRSDHLGSIAILRKEAFVNDQWFLPGSVSLVVDYPEAGSYASDPSQLLSYDVCGPPALRDWMAGLPAEAFDYVWLLETYPMPRSHADRWLLIAERSGSRLYRKRDQAGRVSTQP